MTAAEGHARAIGRKFRVPLGDAGSGELVPSSGGFVKEKQVAGGSDQQVLAGFRPGGAALRYTAVLPIEGVVVRRLDRGFVQFAEVEQLRCLPGTNVVKPQLFALLKDKFLPVGTPNGGTGVFGAIRRFHYRVNRDRLFRSRNKQREGQQESNEAMHCCDCGTPRAGRPAGFNLALL